MENKFEEISSMLDKVIGGKSSATLFNLSIETDDTEICTTSCTDNCGEYVIGVITGEKKGNIYKV